MGDQAVIGGLELGDGANNVLRCGVAKNLVNGQCWGLKQYQNGYVEYFSLWADDNVSRHLESLKHVRFAPC
jgi:hypothetical protein